MARGDAMWKVYAISSIWFKIQLVQEGDGSSHADVDLGRHPGHYDVTVMGLLIIGLRQNGRHFAGDDFGCIFGEKKKSIFFHNSLHFPEGPFEYNIILGNDVASLCLC